MTRGTRLVVVGASGFGREVLDVVEAGNRCADAPVELVGVLDDAPSAENLERLRRREVPFVGTVADWLDRGDDARFLVAIGNPAVRRAVVARFETHGTRSLNVVHPGAAVGSCVTWGDGVAVCGGAQISTEVSLGDHVHVNPGAVVGHDTRLEPYVSVNPAAIVSGACVIESGALLGAGSVVLQGLRVGAGAVVGAAACVTKDVPAGVTATGVPARW